MNKRNSMNLSTESGKSTLLEDVVASFLDSVTEREFDAPFLALLRAHGFSKIHLLHGQFEFGKDMIAQRGDPPTQFVFQTKEGDINLGKWTSSVRGQVDVMRLNTLAHPDFDPALPREGILVLTGRLIGGAPLEVQNYVQQVGTAEPTFDVWDRERLIELFTASPGAGLMGSSDGPLLELIGRIDLEKVTESRIERFSERWIGGAEGAHWKALLEAAVVANRLRGAERLDLAAFTSLCLLRAIWATVHGTEELPETVTAQHEAAVAMFDAYGRMVWELCSEELFGPEALIRDDIGLLVTYPVQCARLLEVLGLYGLREDDAADDIAAWLEQFMTAQPGAAHPLSDRWAVSLIPAIVLVGRRNRSPCRIFLTDVLRWLGDRHDQGGLGLAGPHAEPEEEVEYFLGDCLDHVQLEPRRASYLAAVVLDLAAALEDAELYDLAYNEVGALDIRPFVALPRDDVSQYMTSGHGVDVPVNTSPRYAESFSDGAGWRTALHHDDDLTRYFLGRLGRYWDQLSLSVVTRDRHWVAVLHHLLQAQTTPSDQ
jgi:hypothetical protein